MSGARCVPRAHTEVLGHIGADIPGTCSPWFLTCTFITWQARMRSPKVTEPLRGHDLIAPASPEPFPPHLWRLCTFTLDESRYVIRCTHWICRVKVQVFVTQQLLIFEKLMTHSTPL